ncbi:molybdenum cofactor synthesis domain protein [Thermodesulfobium narugense DSM 14796]|uniref:Molybdopterin molybdenumtransferase n=1 Tax=Thermodesulfobium narugense DSM 14796 TaxID=747365 RepID=M1E7C7_9BACT|nr:molybdopterin molybdotransferase MoeA [Thermodesulfobium narugense]AEE14593.1 molybdenum cofactor synthesis domain protein [Thermodesulfobium narugense DSM 14796]
MIKFLKLSSYQKALSFCELFLPIEVYEEINVFELNNRVSFEDVFSKFSLPMSNRSSVDGFAVFSEETFGSSENTPVLLKLQGEQKVNDPPIEVKKGGCVRVATGSSLPDNSDGVVMIENAKISGDFVEIYKPISYFENVLKKGEDFKEGSVLVNKGKRINFRDSALLAAAGFETIKVYRKPRVAIISTGDEIISYKEKISVTKIYDANGPLIANGIGKYAEAFFLGVVKDSKKDLEEKFEYAIENCDCIFISGGSSVGERDYIEEVIKNFGEVIYHGFLVKPGKPLLLGKRNNIPIIGFPGHPLPVMIHLNLVGIPVLKKLGGDKNYYPKSNKGILGDPVFSIPGRVDLIMGYRKDNLIIPLLSKSDYISLAAKSEFIIKIPEDREIILEGEEVEIYLWD